MKGVFWERSILALFGSIDIDFNIGVMRKG